jgi:hypothetical protein
VPITITPQTEGGIVGPFLPLFLQSDFIGPLASNAIWNVDFTSIPGEKALGSTSLFLNQNPVVLTPWDTRFNQSVDVVDNGVTDGSNVSVNAKLYANGVPGGITDTGAITAPMHYSPGLANSMALIQQQLNSGVLTTAQSDQLNAIQTTVTDTQTGLQIPITDSTGTHNRSLAEILTHTTLDQFVTGEVTSGETADPVRATVGAFWYSVVVQVLTVPDSLPPQTPDQQFYLPDLAVLRIIRGTDQELRYPIHSPDVEVFNPLDVHALAFSPAMLFGIAPEFTLAVDWRIGCSGRVFLKVFP